MLDARLNKKAARTYSASGENFHKHSTYLASFLKLRLVARHAAARYEARPHVITCGRMSCHQSEL